jgi:hypothetical protein
MIALIPDIRVCSPGAFVGHRGESVIPRGVTAHPSRLADVPVVSLTPLF